MITGHQAFFTREAMTEIAEVTLQNIKDVEESGSSPNRLVPEDVLG